MDIPITLDRLRQAARLGVNQHWCVGAMDGEPCLRAYAFTQTDPPYMGMVMLAALGDESWNPGLGTNLFRAKAIVRSMQNGQSYVLRNAYRVTRSPHAAARLAVLSEAQ